MTKTITTLKVTSAGNTEEPSNFSMRERGGGLTFTNFVCNNFGYTLNRTRNLSKVCV